MNKHDQAAEILFKNKLSEIASCIEEDDLEKLLYGCSDSIPDGDRERINSTSKLFQELEKRGKLDVDNKEFLADLLGNIGYKKLADDLLEILSGRTWDRIEKLKNQGRVSFKEQKFCKARDAYCEALKLIPPSYSQNSEIAKEWRALTLKCVRCLIQQGNVNGDISCFKNAHEVYIADLLKQDPEDLRAKLLLAESFVGLEQYDDALKELEILIKAKPKDPDVLRLYKKVLKAKFGDRHQDRLPHIAMPQQVSTGIYTRRKITATSAKPKV